MVLSYAKRRIFSIALFHMTIIFGKLQNNTVL